MGWNMLQQNGIRLKNQNMGCVEALGIPKLGGCKKRIVIGNRQITNTQRMLVHVYPAVGDGIDAGRVRVPMKNVQGCVASTIDVRHIEKDTA